MKNLEGKKIKSFMDLRNGDKIISPIDNEVTGFFVDCEGNMYLASRRCLFELWQFDEDDFYIYDGEKEIGETDAEYFL